MDMFDYSSHFFHKLASAHDPAAPIQIELHPGPHCDLYRCPHCYGDGQFPLTGPLATVEAIDSSLAEVEAFHPTVLLSGITTEPLTYPHAAALIRAIRARTLTLGLYTKGRRLDAETREALVRPGASTFVTLSLDAVSNDEYVRRHGLRHDRKDAAAAAGGDYFGLVLENLKRLRQERDTAGSGTEIRGAFLLFADNATRDTVRAALDLFGNHVDLLRFALPQDRNDGAPPGALPERSRECLADLARDFAHEPKVRIVQDTDRPGRDRSFRRCWAQRFQVVIDKAGNAFPCPQVAVRPYAKLSYGNIRDGGLKRLLVGEPRRAMFQLDVDGEMGCRICDRKDEALNLALSGLDQAYGALDARRRTDSQECA